MEAVCSVETIPIRYFVLTRGRRKRGGKGKFDENSGREGIATRNLDVGSKRIGTGVVARNLPENTNLSLPCIISRSS
jgi:hypothetical protein